METWFSVVVCFCILALVHALFHVKYSKSHKNKKLPPGPSLLSSNLLLLTSPVRHLESILRSFTQNYGPLITFKIGFQPAIFIGSQSLAHKVLVRKHGAVFADRPKPNLINSLVTRNQHNINSAPYGPTWRLLRRNLATEILHPSRVKSFSWARQRVLGILIRCLQSDSLGVDATVKVVDHFHFAMFRLLGFLCFGDKLDENQVKEIMRVQRRVLLAIGGNRFNILNVMPRLGKILFRNRWMELKDVIHDQEQVLTPLIKACIDQANPPKTEGVPVAYVDTLVNLQLLEEDNRNLTCEEMVALCGEFFNGGVDTTSTSLQWIMANLVKYPHIQDNVFREIVAVVGPPPSLPPPSGQEEKHVLEKVVSEEDLEKMPYLKAVILEGLRRHPPTHFLLPHKVNDDVELEGYMVPKNATIFFMVADMAWDPKVWNDPMEFKPERFLVKTGDQDDTTAAAFDITGTKEIKMMPFGAGRRICPGSSLAMLHLEFFVANLLWYFKWTAADGDEVDLSETHEFTVFMKNPLHAHLSPRSTIDG